jgi:hypothetical protein
MAVSLNCGERLFIGDGGTAWHVINKILLPLRRPDCRLDVSCYFGQSFYYYEINFTRDRLKMTLDSD